MPGPTNPKRDQIVALRRQGIGPREIARRLGLSPGAVAGVLGRLLMAKRVPEYGYPDELRAEVLASLTTMSVDDAAGKHEVASRTIYQWRKEAAA